MQRARPVGREAASKKYDILSALMAHALSLDPASQKLALRLMSLITTRYNWQRDELTIGQTEIARLWCVDPRTVKREMAKLAKEIDREGMTLVPLKLYFNEKGLVKVLLGLGRGKKIADRRESEKKREADREMARALRNHG